MAGGEPCLEIGQAIGSYKVVRQLGEGGMGEVYEVFDEELQRRAALKVVPPELARNQDVVARFQREAKALSQLRHPSIVHVFVYGVLPFLRNAPYFIMEYLEGETLRVRIQQAAKEPPGRLGIAYLSVLQQIAKALAAVHQRGLVHRDLKPSNVTTERNRTPNDPQRFEVLANAGLGSGSIFCFLRERPGCRMACNGQVAPEAKHQPHKAAQSVRSIRIPGCTRPTPGQSDRSGQTHRHRRARWRRGDRIRAQKRPLASSSLPTSRQNSSVKPTP